MTLEQLIPELEALSRDDKRQLMRLLALDLGTEEIMALLGNYEFPIWSPVGEYEAAHALSEFIAQSESP